MRVGDQWICNIDNIDQVLGKILDGTMGDVAEAVKDGVDKTASDMAKRTRKTAPKDDGRWESKGFPNKKGRVHGTFKKHIKIKKEGQGFQRKDTWYVSGTEKSLTHLLEHGHEQFVYGKRSTNSPTFKGYHFIEPARDQAEAEIEGNVAEAYDKIVGGGN